MGRGDLGHWTMDIGVGGVGRNLVLFYHRGFTFAFCFVRPSVRYISISSGFWPNKTCVTAYAHPRAVDADVYMTLFRLLRGQKYTLFALFIIKHDGRL